MNQSENIFANELEVFRTEAESAIHIFPLAVFFFEIDV